jgi:hypothetical protein
VALSVAAAALLVATGTANASADYIDTVPTNVGNADAGFDVSSSAGLPAGSVYVNIEGDWLSPNASLTYISVTNNTDQELVFYTYTAFVDYGGQFNVNLPNVAPHSSAQTNLDRKITGTWDCAYILFKDGDHDSGPGGAATKVEEV